MLPARLPCASAVLVLAAAASARADLRLPAVLGDHMVVQRNTPARVWGWADPGAEVSVAATWGGPERRATAVLDGTWSVELDAPEAGGPHAITVRSAGEEILLADVLAGDVWLCSGQSNMEWPLAHTDGGEADVAAAGHPRIRLFGVAREAALAERDDCAGGWRRCTPESARDFSAVGYHFGRRLHAELDVPIGLVGASWSGTRAEAWVSAPTLRAGFPETHPDLDRAAELRRGEGAEPALAERQAEWWRRLEASDPGFALGWMDPELDDAAWTPAQVPGRWADFGHGERDGCLWYRTEVDVPAAWAGLELVLELGPVDDMDVTWLHGTPVGASCADGLASTPRRYAIPAGVARAGSNVITVCAVDTGGLGALGSEAMRLWNPEADEAVALDGSWRCKPGLDLDRLGAFPRGGWLHPNRASALFDGMIAPLLPLRIRGVIWYQGESNWGRAFEYRRLFPALIDDWRRRWGQGALPFYFVQIAPYAYPGDAGQLGLLRESQTLALDLASTGMAVTLDVGDPADIHPRDKRTVGERLARLALAGTYGRDVACAGPVLERFQEALVAEVDPGLPTPETPSYGRRGLRVVFRNAAGLTSRGEPLRAFEVAGADRVFHPADAFVLDDSVMVTSAAVAHPVAVRYAWRAGDEGNLWNGAGLPAGSFRTDDWPLPL